MSKKYMTKVPYLEDTDFNADGSLKPNVTQGKPVVVMVQGVFCGYCTQAKPAFEQFAHSTPNVVGATIQIDGSPSEKKASTIVGQLYQSQGVPLYLGFNKDGKFVRAHTGGRDVASIKTFASSL